MERLGLAMVVAVAAVGLSAWGCPGDDGDPNEGGGGGLALGGYGGFGEEGGFGGEGLNEGGIGGDGIGGSGGPPTSPCSAIHAYGCDEFGAQIVAASYAAGAAISLPTSPYAISNDCGRVKASPDGSVALASALFTNDLYAFTRDAVTGALSAALGSPIDHTAPPGSIAFDSVNPYGFVVSPMEGEIRAYDVSDIDAVQLVGTAAAGMLPRTIVLHESSNTAFVVDGGGIGGVDAGIIAIDYDPMTGALTSNATYGGLTNAVDASLDANGVCLQVATNAGVVSYSVDANGGLTEGTTYEPGVAHRGVVHVGGRAVVIGNNALTAVDTNGCSLAAATDSEAGAWAFLALRVHPDDSGAATVVATQFAAGTDMVFVTMSAGGMLSEAARISYGPGLFSVDAVCVGP